MVLYFCHIRIKKGVKIRKEYIITGNNRCQRKKVLVLICIIIILVILWNYISYYNKTKIVSHRYEWWLEYLNIKKDYYTSTGRNVKVAIIDTGVDFSHPDLKHIPHKIYTIKGINKESNEDYEHGTLVAGIICAKPSDTNGVMGINPNCSIVSIDISDNNTTADSYGLIEAIQIAMDENVDIINISLGFQVNNEDVHTLIKEAYSRGIIIVAAAGNDEFSDIIYPAKYNEVLSVGSINKSGKKMYDNTINNSIIYFPGENIVSTYSSLGSNIMYKSMDGTSLSAPMLTGIISLIYKSNASITSKEVYNYFGNNSVNINPKNIIEHFEEEYK